MKTPITYYGGKQKLLPQILKLIPQHNLYCEPFVGGGAVFFGKDPSHVEVINDTNKEVVNFYRVVQNDFVSLEKEIRITLHSRDLHRKASVIYNNPDMFSELKRAWAFWTLATQSFAGIVDGNWGYDISKATTSKKIYNKRESFDEKVAIRLQQVQIECADALRIIVSRDTPDAFFYCDPPYFNSDCGHYDGYTIEDFQMLLEALSKIDGKFLLSSYPSDLLEGYVKRMNWHQVRVEAFVSVANNCEKPPKKKVECLTFNYEM